MNTTDILVEIDAEISRLQQAKALLNGTNTVIKRKPGCDHAATPNWWISVHDGRTRAMAQSSSIAHSVLNCLPNLP
jgi:hypothetical protein